MPTYRYRCSKCGHELEEFQQITADPLTRCPDCGDETLTRIIGGGGGVIFKGSGFYLTDYKNAGPEKTARKKGDEKSSDKKTDSGGGKPKEGKGKESPPKED